MNNIENTLQSINSRQISGETFYSMYELKNALESSTDEYIEFGDYGITPYYIADGKILELYEYELTISKDESNSFEEFILNLTGRDSIESVPADIIELRRNCFIRVENDFYKMKKQLLIDFFDFVMNEVAVRRQVESSFGAYDKKNIFFELY
ncbi:MAG: hypothetical protein E7235_05605 [Lachnospiraceae bacterium]|nr:hypothetical protein [Lachnospiraceae bacterium]